jgi:murein DD-endopeptidase MepM/ murein hydrolase activator NlpD
MCPECQGLWIRVPAYPQVGRRAPHRPGLAGTLILVRADNLWNPDSDRRPALPSRRRGPRLLRWVAAFALLMMAVAGTAVAQPSAVRGAGTLPHSPSGAPSASALGYRAPLAGQLQVLRPFEPPPTPYAAGHRGVDLDAPAAAWVLAAGAGRVTFAGQVAGRGVVVIAHPDGVRTEYEPVAPSVTPGQAIAQGERIGRLDGQHDQWPPGRSLHWGARRGAQYLDPLDLLHPLGPVRLLPWPP